MSEHLAAASEALENAEEKATEAEGAAQAALDASHEVEATAERLRIAERDLASEARVDAHVEAAETIQEHKDDLEWLKTRMETQEAQTARILDILTASVSMPLNPPLLTEEPILVTETVTETETPLSVVVAPKEVETQEAPEPEPPKKPRFRLM